MAAALSPLAPTSFPDLPDIEGVRLATGAAGIRDKDRTDVMLAVFDKGTQAAGVFTKSKCPSAPVEWCRARLKAGKARALVVNSGNANAFTGKAGMRAFTLTAGLAASATGAPATEIFLASTGVIGEPLDASKFGGVLEELAACAAPDGLLEAAKAIMTTDTYPKVATDSAMLAGVEVILSGMAKGAGMIAPDMATMLAFVFTDAPIAATPLQSMLAKSVERSFNAITIDSDTSTSDTLMLFATGAAAKRGAPKIAAANDRRLAPFKKALDLLLLDLAHQVRSDLRHLDAVRDRGRRQTWCAKNRRRQRPPPRSIQKSARSSSPRSGASGRARRGRRAQIHRGEGDPSGNRRRRQKNCFLGRQFATGQNGDRRRGCQLGTRREGRWQGRRTGRTRQTVDLVQRCSRRPQGPARPRL